MTHNAAKYLDAANLLEVDDGALAVAIDRELRKLYLDIADRPTLKDARTLDLKVKLAPTPDHDGELRFVDVTFLVQGKMPAKGMTIPMRMMHTTQNATGLQFSTADAHNPDQPALPMGMDDDDGEMDGQTRASGG